MDKAKTQSKAKELVTQAREAFRIDAQADKQNRLDALEDLKFLHIPGEQWEQHVRTERQERPMYTFNKLRITVKRVVNDMRANRPSGKVRPVEDSDVDTAQTLEGLVRNIWNVSDGDTVIDAAAEYQVGGGMGAWRVNTKYSHDEAFDQDIVIEAIRNPFCLHWDHAAVDPLKRDARRWFLESRIPKTEYERRYPGKEVIDFEGASFSDDADWSDEDTVRICEYWYKEPVKKTIALMPDGKTVDADQLPEGALAQAIKTREVESYKILMCILSGDALLEGPVSWAGSQFPFVVVFGEEMYLDRRFRWFGLTRFAKDAQRSYNMSRTLAIESAATAVNAKYWATPAQAIGHEKAWAEAHKNNWPHMLFNVDPQNPGPPQRMGSPDMPIALIQETQISNEDIKGVTGIYDPSLGKQSNETSGVAIRARQSQGEIANFNFMDNHSKGVRRTWELCIDLAPKIYDTTRAVRILGSDGGEKYVKLNEMGPDGKTINDLSRGKYDVAVTTGPAFSTQRQEASEIYGQMAQANPELYQIAGDLIFKAMDLPYANEIAERIKVSLPPQIQAIVNKDNNEDPRIQAAMAQVDQAMQQVQQQGQLVQQAAQEAQGEKATADKAKADVQIAISNLKVQEAHIATQEAQFKQLVAEAKSQMQLDQGGADTSNEREQLTAQLEQALGQIQQQAAKFNQDAMEMMTKLHQATQPQVIVANPPKRKVARIKRVGGELIGTLEDVPDDHDPGLH